MTEKDLRHALEAASGRGISLEELKLCVNDPSIHVPIIQWIKDNRGEVIDLQQIKDLLDELDYGNEEDENQ